MGKSMPVQVADQPAHPRLRLHMAQEGHQLRIRHMVRHLAGDDEVEPLRLVQIVAGPIVDGKFGRSRVAGRGKALFIEVHADQLGLYPALPGPAGDRAQDVAVSETDIEQAEMPGRTDRAVEEGDGGPGSEGPAVHAGEVVQHPLIDGGVQVRRVHLLFLPRTDRKVGHMPSLLLPHHSISSWAWRCMPWDISPRS
ncbi:proteophosphoglycan 5 [Sphingobium fuliginis]|uniref:Proteophosphoglycan 5 n=1 Tax=Sphingobium fuliginis (strain ATCC 27551) TaxID=336203 RepID=A0A292ZNP2_SPHSA|nr:proteophosphoglycan 5 [Sphingobium fuliginis]